MEKSFDNINESLHNINESLRNIKIMLQNLITKLESGAIKPASFGSAHGEALQIRNSTTIINDQEIHDLGDLNNLREDKIIGDKNKISITNNKGREGIQKMFQGATIQDQELISVKENQPDMPIQVHESKHPKNHDNNYLGELNNTAEDEIVGQRNATAIPNDDCRLSKEKFNRLLQEEIRHKVEMEEHKKKVKMKLQRQGHEVCLRKGEMYKAYKMFDEITEMFLKHLFFKNRKDVEILVKNVRHKERFKKKNKIAFGAAMGLAYLREDCFPKTFHKDSKSKKNSLDEVFEARVADIGLAKLNDTTRTHVSTRVIGTFGYLAPAYASSGKLTKRVDVFSFGISLISEHVSLILREIDSSQKKFTKMEKELLGYESIDLSRPNIASELKLFFQHHQLPLGKDSRTAITEMVSSVGHLCEKSTDLLTEYMTYRVSGPCPDDWSLAQKLILRGCEPLPRRRCFAKSVPKVDLQSFPPTLTEKFFIDALWFVNDSSVKESLWKPVSDKIITWSGLGCKNFDCLNSKKSSREGAGCFDLGSANENQRYVKVRGKNDFLINDVLALGSGGIRIGFDYQGGVSFFSSSTWSTKIFSTTQVPHCLHIQCEFQKHKLEDFLNREEMEDTQQLFEEMPEKNIIQDLVSPWICWHMSPQATNERKKQRRIQSNHSKSQSILGFLSPNSLIWDCFPFQLGLDSIPTLTYLVPLSILADIVNLGVMGIVMIEDVMIFGEQMHVLKTFGDFSYGGDGMILPLEYETRDRDKLGKALAFLAEEFLDGDTRFKYAPSIRDAANKEKLWEALMNGHIDMLRYHSSTVSELKLFGEGNFLKAWGGISSLQFVLPVTWSYGQKYGLPLEQPTSWWVERGLPSLLDKFQREPLQLDEMGSYFGVSWHLWAAVCAVYWVFLLRQVGSYISVGVADPFNSDGCVLID